MQKKRLTFGVVAAQASDIEQRRIMEGIIRQAKELNIDTVVISNIYNPDKSAYTLDCRKENNIYELLGASGFDGFILLAEAIINTDLQTRIRKTLQARPDIPVVVIGTPSADLMLDHFEVISTDDSADIEDIADHLIEKHGCSDIDIITGSPDTEVSLLRVEGYRKSLEKHSISFDSRKVIYGDFWTTSGQNLAKQYISGERHMPQALICANDYMAYGLLDEFSAQNISVPESMIVVGYEYILQRIFHYPVLSTYRRNRAAIGAEAVNILFSKINRRNYTSGISLKGKFISGDSCGCGICREEYTSELLEEKTEQKYRFFNLFSDFAERLTVCTSMSEYVAALAHFTYMVRDLDAMYLCLLEDWYNSETAESNSGAVMNCYTIKNNFTNEYKTSFVTENDISAILSYCSEPCAYYFNPLFFGDRYFGYIVTVYRNPNTYDSIFRNWLKTVSNALEMLRLKNDINYLTQCRGLSQQHDTSTGMFNRAGFESAVRRAAAASPEDSEICILLLKTELFSENIQFDNQESKLKTLKEIADIMKSLSTNKNELCGRISETAYVFAGFGSYPEHFCTTLTDRLSCMLLHASSYISEHGTNSFVCIAETYPAGQFNYEAAITDMAERINQEAALRTEQQRQPHFSDFQNLRDTIYLDPSGNHYSDELCQKLCLSTGYFRNIYKKYFDISYHQDCIRSKITLAKYLLCTTSMSITAIASRCGYEDEKYFMRLFQQNTSHTPNKYRMLFQ
ncbi:MAG: substrate-binding domain-containing protein [Oscillospiraceae bacterium]|nr:substrate-binding domain-containing protein [Oscillospiraceae bacterium]